MPATSKIQLRPYGHAPRKLSTVDQLVIVGSGFALPTPLSLEPQAGRVPSRKLEFSV